MTEPLEDNFLLDVLWIVPLVLIGLLGNLQQKIDHTFMGSLFLHCSEQPKKRFWLSREI